MPATGSVADISTMAAVTPTPAQAVERVPAAKRPTPQLTEFERRVEKLLKAVRDGDIQMVRVVLTQTSSKQIEWRLDSDVPRIHCVHRKTKVPISGQGCKGGEKGHQSKGACCMSEGLRAPEVHFLL